MKYNVTGYILFCIRQRISNLLQHIKCGFQRCFKGYDDDSVIYFNSEFRRYCYNVLTAYKKTWDSNFVVEDKEEWYKALEEMIHCLEMMDEKTVRSTICQSMPENFNFNLGDIYEIRERYKDRFFELLSKYFYQLGLYYEISN